VAGFQRNPGSFRDPSGYVFSDGERILRGLNKTGTLEFESARTCGLLSKAFEKGLLIDSRVVDASALGNSLTGARGEIPVQVIEHPRIPLITYPYEWTFEQLRDAALQHLDLQLLALAHNFELSDATAYNMQFDVGLPLHIDVLSLRRYRDGRPWEGYNQFCRQFIYPLLLENALGVPFQRWYRGSINGVELDEMMRLLPAWRRYTSLNLLMHVQLQAKAVKNASSNNLSNEAIRLPKISKKQYQVLLEGLRDWVASMTSKRSNKTYWADYASINSYSNKERSDKQAFVERTVRRWRSGALLDVGGNSAEYSEAAIAGGASRAYCVDGDVDALEIAYKKRKQGMGGLLPLVMNWADPSPSQGWAAHERASLQQRMQVDTVMALAVVHHIVVGGNVPLSEFVRQLFAYGRKVIVEFVPKNDPMVKGLLRNREDVFGDYTEDNFIRLLELHSTIEEVYRIREKGRVLFACSQQ
jgi:ribosomal protein L11 methylase PrmA